MAKPTTFGRRPRPKATGGTSFNFGANAKPRKPRGNARKGGKGGGS